MPIPHRDPITDPFAVADSAPVNVASSEAAAAGDLPLPVEELNARFENGTAQQVVAWSIEHFGRGIVMSSSFGAESALLIHLATQLMPDIRIIMVDTGYLFPETHQFMADLR
ncbi:MAG: phosphoadenosine phosphosulfate reductase family protein, partial [Phycisphaerae bacterium]|nr:phosphoadenosine phosphosulfate reductase family protein [Phycisphaerae bacterium]